MPRGPSERSPLGQNARHVALDADRDLFQAEFDLARLRLEEMLSVVQLYKSLGGGWQ